jgi:hypothetical protein
MKTLLITARNHVLNLLEIDGEPKLIPSAEVVLTLAEPKYAQRDERTIVKYPDCETVRFHCSSRSLRTLSKDLATYADELEDAFSEHIDIEDDDQTRPRFKVFEYADHIKSQPGHPDYSINMCDQYGNPIPGTLICQGNNKRGLQVVARALCFYGADLPDFKYEGKAAEAPPVPGIQPEPHPLGADVPADQVHDF